MFMIINLEVKFNEKSLKMFVKNNNNIIKIVL